MDGSMDQDQLHAEKARALREQRGGLSGRMDRLAQTLEHMDDALGLLENRLDPVLVPETPAATLRPEATPEESRLAQQLLHVTERAENLLRKLQELSGRVDL